jgi:heterodisulfide reductase subunit C
MGHVYPRGGCTGELPGWERLWDNFTQEELRVDASHANQPKSEEEKNVALHAKKSSEARGSRDMGKVRCFACHKIGHCASKCPNKKRRSQR